MPRVELRIVMPTGMLAPGGGLAPAKFPARSEFFREASTFVRGRGRELPARSRELWQYSTRIAWGGAVSRTARNIDVAGGGIGRFRVYRIVACRVREETGVTQSRHQEEEPAPVKPPLDSACATSVRLGNQFLARLPRGALARLMPHLQEVALEGREVLFHAHEPLRDVYFPTTAVISLVSRLESGQTLEVGLVGRDGVAGTAVFPGISWMPCDGVVQIAGRACRISAETLRRELQGDERLYSAMGRFAQVLHVRCMQGSVCNMFHSVEQRCTRWLLTVSDISGSADLPLTHELIAVMLGVHRPTVSLVLKSLRGAGLIDEQRGRITLRDRHKLEEACCECYGVLRAEQMRLLGT
jgi:CRP-like cAMP-binding protein